jgi:enamine deaminase RidA (YjgF/YER057c/UK114 family)
MADIQARLAELAITIPHRSPSPAGTYVPAVLSNNLVYTAGQLPLVDGALPVVGKVGAAVSPQEARECARIAALNALSAVAEVVGSLDRVVRIVKVVGFVASDPAFTSQPSVVDGASAVLGDIFQDAGVHARSAVGVAVLPLDAPVEIELIVEISCPITTQEN